MRKISYLIIACMSFTVFNSCEEADLDPDLNYLTFQSEDVDISVPEDGTASQEFNVYTSNVTGSERTYNLMVNEGGTSLPSSAYTAPTSVTIPANSNVGSFTVNFSDNGIANSGDTLSFMFDANQDIDISAPYTINILRDCPSDLAGTYSVVTDGTSTDAAPVNNPLVDFEYEVTITETSPKSYSISDGVAGVYQDWYCVPYDYCYETPGNFSDVCGNLSGSWVEGFDSTVNLTGTVNADGTLSITWSNGFGDTGTAIYTRI